VQLTHALLGVLIYYAYVTAIGKWCRNNNISRPLAFRVGAAACILLALIAIVGVSLYFGRVMLINEDPLVTAGCVMVIALLGGLRCRDQIPRTLPDKT